MSRHIMFVLFNYAVPTTYDISANMLAFKVILKLSTTESAGAESVHKTQRHHSFRLG
jgi:hypothetical protein